VNLWMLSSVG